MGHRRQSLLAVLTVLALAGASAPSLADSRIFTARSSVAGVTIDQAVRNGETLAIVGHGDGTTLFRIDSPSTPVGCANRIDFVASTGERVEQVADMCALNWDVTVQVKPPGAPAAASTATGEPAGGNAAGAAGGETAAEPTGGAGAPPAEGTFSQTVTVSADDPSVTIISVALDGEPVKITGRDGGAVKFELAGSSDTGIVCERNIGLTLSDGRQVAQPVNICLNDWTVTVALAGNVPAGAAANAEPPALPVTPPPPPSTAQPEPPGLPAPPPAAMATAPNPEMVWMFSSAGDRATLIHGIPETDSSEFDASCVRQSGVITVTLSDANVVGLAPGSGVPITFSAGAFSRTYPGVGSPVDQIVGGSLPQADISAGDPLWSALISETALGASAGPTWSGLISLAGSAGPARQLLAACSQVALAPPPPLPLPGLPSGPGIVATYFCGNGSAITVRFNGAQQTAVLAEVGAPPLMLRWDPARNVSRYSAGAARLTIRSDNEVRWTRFGGPPQTCRAR